MIQFPVAPPPRRRSRVAEKDGRPGAPPSRGCETQDATDQRVSAALGQGRALARARNSVAPLVPAASASLLIATHIRREAALADRLQLLEDGRLVAEHRRGEAGYAATLAMLRPD